MTSGTRDALIRICLCMCNCEIMIFKVKRHGEFRNSALNKRGETMVWAANNIICISNLDMRLFKFSFYFIFLIGEVGIYVYDYFPQRMDI